MKSKDVVMSEEDSSNEEEEMVDQESEMESEEDNVDEYDLDASATDSDEDESEVDDDFEDEKPEENKSKNEKVKEALLKRYQERQGKQLYLRFPHKVPESQEALDEKIKELVPLAVKAHKPRQRYVRFCLIDFATKEDRDAALSQLKKSIKKGELQKYVVNIPRTESTDFVEELAERKIKSLENKKAKQQLKKATKKALKENNFTTSVVVLNLPKNTSTLQIRELFANAVDINVKPGKGKLNINTSIAAVTFPTTLDARNATKMKLSLGGNQLNIKFDNRKLMKKLKSKNVQKKDETNQQTDSATKQGKSETTLNKAKNKSKVPAKK